MPVTTSMMTQEEYGQVYQVGFVKTVRMLRSRGASLEHAEDIAQRAWLQGWRKLGQLRDKSALVGWINKIAVNFHHRSGAYEARNEELPEEGMLGHSTLDSAFIDVVKILGICTPADRELLEQQLGGFTTHEIAARQGASSGAIRLRLLRARRSVRSNLESGARALRKAYCGELRAA